MPLPPTGLDAELVDEFADEARRNYAALLSALSRVAHPDESERSASHEARTAATALCECWQSASLLGVPAAELRNRFPLATPSAVNLVNFLLAVASYSENFSEDAELAGHVLRQLSKTVSGEEAGSSSDSKSFG